MGKHCKPKSKKQPKHAAPKEGAVTNKVAAFGVAAVSVPTLALTFTPSAQAATTQNIPRIVIPAGGGAPACEDYIVKHGDTLSGVAAAHGIEPDVLKPLNPGVIARDRPDDYSLIFGGGHVHLPDGKCDPVTPPPAAPPPAKKNHPWTHKHKRWNHHRPQTSPPPSNHPTPAPPPSTGGGSVSPVIAPDCPGTKSGYCAHSPSFWGPLIEQAMTLVGGNVAANHDVSGVQALMALESSGDPNAINNYDSNAQHGDPSRGLMQTIGATFNAYHVARTSTNIYDPLANIAAALAYINAQYGGVIPGSPY